MNRLINRAIESPIPVIFITILMTLVIGYGLKWFLVDDDFFKIFPQDLESRKVWEDITNQFGDSELLFIAFGNDGESIYNEKAFNSLRKITNELNSDSIPIIKDVFSISTIIKLEDGESLLPNGHINSNTIENVKSFGILLLC